MKRHISLTQQIRERLFFNMNHRERFSAIMHYKEYDRIPVLHFGFWSETLHKWADEGHITREEAQAWYDGGPADMSISKKLGFDYNYYRCYHVVTDLVPAFESKVVETMPDGSRKVMNNHGVIILQKDDAGSIPKEIDHLLKGRKEWEEHFLPRLQFSADRATIDDKTKAYIEDPNREEPYGLHCGSLFGMIRNWLGVEGSAYLYADDEEVFSEMIEHVGELSYQCVKIALEQTSAFDFAHFWEDICFKSGPLISPRVFADKVGPQYKRITDLVNSYGIDIVSLDCDGCIDALIPTWLKNGVNTMFPIEVGTWNASIKPWREQFGKEIRGVGGTNKTVFARDYAAVDAEVERLRPLVELGGYIPCPDHRIAPDAKWENVQYYCEQMRKMFG